MPQFTPMQEEAINSEGTNLLISASAGAGKTTVLVNRLIKKIIAGVNVDDLLVVTFTKAAAKEMKTRISQEIQSELRKSHNPEIRRHLLKQIPLVNQANISTIHSFCTKVIQRYYYLIDLDPVFRMLTDETEVVLLQEEILDKVFNDLLESNDTEFIEFLKQFSSDRNLDKAKEVILKVYQFAVSKTNPDFWLDNLSYLYQVENEDSIEASPLYQEHIKVIMVDFFTNVTETYQALLKQIDSNPSFEKTTALLDKERSSCQAILDTLKEDDLNRAYDDLVRLDFPTYSRLTKEATDEDKELNKVIKDGRTQLKKDIKEFKEKYFAVDPTRMYTLLKESHAIVQTIGKVAKLFKIDYQKAKAEIKALDFNDLEHFTLDILTHNEVNDGRVVLFATEASDYYRNKFEEVMVDEYQDVNELQETIIKYVSKEVRENSPKGNQFMVGDIKQSIYGFRLADPTLFAQKYIDFKENKGGKRIILAENFRSRYQVLNFTNYIFKQIMDREFGDIDYDKNAMLVHGNKNFPDSPNFSADILLFHKDVKSDESNQDGVEIEESIDGEIQVVGQSINEWMTNPNKKIWDKKNKTWRKPSYSDFAILTPTKSNNIRIQEIFSSLNIPVLMNETQNYFRTTEISTIVSLLKIIDNPIQDIPLVAVLRSPIVGLDEPELTEIRLTNKQSQFYYAIQDYLDRYKDTELSEKLNSFMSQLDSWRTRANRVKLVELIWQIYLDTGYLDYVAGLVNGKQRQANLHALYERANQYEENGYKGLFRFIRFIEKMQKKDKDLAQPKSLSTEDDSVKVMTIHASKGLEFPVVYLLNTNRGFNIKDAQGSYVLNEDYGLGIVYKDLSNHIEYPTWPELVLKEERKEKLLAEQMRLLYVALTRAEQKINIVGSFSDKDAKTWLQAGKEDRVVLSKNLRKKAPNFLSWIIQALIRRKDFENNAKVLVERLDLDQPYNKDSHLTFKNEISHYDLDYEVHVWNENELIDISSPEGKIFEENILKNQKENWLDRIDKEEAVYPPQEEMDKYLTKAHQTMFSPYNHRPATQTPSFRSVSEIKRIFEEPEDGKAPRIDLSPNKRKSSNPYVKDDLDEPQFIQNQEKRVNPAQIGNVTHLILQKVNLNKEITLSVIKEMVDHLVESKVISPTLGNKVDIAAIVSFFESKLGRQIRASHEKIHREVPFSLLIEAKEIFEEINHEDDHLLVHGIIDGYFINEDNQLILFDYKTDYIPNHVDGESFLIERYQSQLKLYRFALETILKRPVDKTYIISIHAEKAFELK